MTYHLVTYISLIQQKGIETKHKTIKNNPWNHHPVVLHNHWGKHKHESILFWNKGWIPAFVFFLSPKVIFIVQCCDVHSVRLQPERWKASWMCLFSETFLSNLFFPSFFTNSYQVESACVLRLFFFKLQLCRVLKNAALVAKRLLFCSSLTGV